MSEKLKEGIYRVCIPFENIYTTAFVLVEGNDAIILDSGSNDKDAEAYVIPAVSELGVNVLYLVSSHTHGDHHGGIGALIKAYPKAVSALFSREAPRCHYLEDGEILLGRFHMLNLKGHTPDSLGVFDSKTSTLLSFDSLQGFGVGRYKTMVCDLDGYLKSLERVKELAPKTIIASHEYEPCGSIIKGEHISEFLKSCKDAVK